MKYVITLVHGNRPKANGRLAEGSFLRRQLESRLPNLAFRDFGWSGTNTHAARTEAGDCLARFIRDGHDQHPDARHYVVAHSHGGNVALYAMRDATACKIVNGIVTLGTPFIYTRRRDSSRYAEVIAWLILLVAALIPLMVFTALGLRPPAVASLLAAPFLMVAMQPRLTRWLIETAAREQEDVVAVLQPPVIEPAKLAILCARGDEVGTWLRIWKVVAEAPLAVGGVLLSLVAAIVRFNFPVTVDYLARTTGRHGLLEMRVFGFDGWALTIGVLLLSMLWVVVLMVSTSVRRPGYWKEPLLANVLVEIGTGTVPRAPEATCHAAYFFDVSPQTVPNLIPRPLRHSAMCEDAAVVGAIVNWIGARSATGAIDAHRVELAG